MSNIRKEIINSAYDRAYSIIQNDDMHKRFELIRQLIRSDEVLNNKEKSDVLKRFDDDYDYFKVLKNDGTERICENCQEKCLAKNYCERCIRDYLFSNFSSWSSGNQDVDNLIMKCQMESIIPYMIVEWIPFNNLQNIELLSNIGCSKIYSAFWTDGNYCKWDSKEMKLIKAGPCKVILRYLQSDEKANRDWIEEANIRLNISNKWGSIVQCFGLTKDPSNDYFVLVTKYMDIDLRKYLQQNRNHITWKTKFKIIFEVIKAISRIHEENYMLRDLHSGNVLYSQDKNDWYINDLKFCGPIDKKSKFVYGKLPYIAPEVIQNYNYSVYSDIYSLAMLMWEISTEQQPFSNFIHNSDFANKIVSGMRPQILDGTPSEYRDLMIQCWDNDPNKRPDINTLWNKVEKINKSIYQYSWNSDCLSLNTSSFIEYESHSKYYNF